jgi:hypothetical protein
VASTTTDGQERRPTGAAARDPEVNRTWGSIGGNERWATLHGEARTAATAEARAAGPGALEYWESKVDPEGIMSPADRTKCATNAKRAYYSRLALASAKSRAGKARTAAQTDSGGE